MGVYIDFLIRVSFLLSLLFLTFFFALSNAQWGVHLRGVLGGRGGDVV